MLELLTKIVLILIGVGAFISVGLPLLMMGIFYVLGFTMLTVHMLSAFVKAVVNIIISPFRR